MSVKRPLEGETWNRWRDYADCLEAEVERLKGVAGQRDWGERVIEVVDQAHAENWGGKHREGFCEACADAYIVAQHAVPGGPDAALPGTEATS